MKNCADEAELRFPELLIHESEAAGLVYGTAKGRRGIEIITAGRDGELNHVFLTERQAHAVAQEIRELVRIYSGYGRAKVTREYRKHETED